MYSPMKLPWWSILLVRVAIVRMLVMYRSPLLLGGVSAPPVPLSRGDAPLLIASARYQ